LFSSGVLLTQRHTRARKEITINFEKEKAMLSTRNKMVSLGEREKKTNALRLAGRKKKRGDY